MKTAFDTATAGLDRLPAAISGAGGHAATFRAACWLIKCGLGDGDAMALLLEYNRRCQPPWKEGELRHKLADARRTVTERLVFTPPVKPPVRLVWKVARTIQPRVINTLQPAPAPTVAAVASPAKPVADLVPWITKAGDLVIPFHSPARFHWWNGGQTISQTRKEARHE